MSSKSSPSDPPASLELIAGNRLQVKILDLRVEHVDIIGDSSNKVLSSSQILFEGSNEWIGYDRRYGSQTQDEMAAHQPDEYSQDGYSQKHYYRGSGTTQPSVDRTTSPTIDDSCIQLQAELINHLSEFFADRRRRIPVKLARAALEVRPEGRSE
ncbi:unnamed protein product [Peniophora sp. CBMAI 1063]|nr:unnamed protein product [Peniophora sp. CBMAI 1063]